ncbi:MAG: cadherin-like domain-containing protein [Devosia sp.]
MMIQAKSTRDPEAKPLDDRKRFELLSPERLSRLPIYVGGIAVVVAAYLKSAMEGRALSLAPETPPEYMPQDLGRPANWCLPGDELLSASLEEDEIDPTITGSIDSDAAEARNQIGIGPPWPGRYIPMDSPTIQFTRPFEPVTPSIQAFFPAAFGLSSSNDNPRAATVGRSDPDGEDSTPDENVDPGGAGDPKSDEEDEDGGGGGNRPPVVAGPVRLNDVFAGQVVVIGLSSLLFGAQDPDGDPLLIMNMSASGIAVVRSSNGWTVSTQPGMLGEVTLTYQITDGEGAVWQTANFDIVRNTQTLTSGDDLHVGTPYDDDIDALDGDDIVDALAGNDLVAGGNGHDHINGGDGDDHLFGGAGDDIIFGGRGDDIILGGDGDDRLFGDEGDDSIDGEDGNDSIHGDAGDDLISGGAGCDELEGGTGDDVLLGEAGDDWLDGGVGNDALIGGTGNDTLKGGYGNDLLDGGAGCDVLDGGAGDDQLTGGRGNDFIAAGGGDDQIAGDAGNDAIHGGAGDDTLDFSATCEDVIVDFIGGQSFSREFGDDSFTGIERVIGGAGDDIFVIGATATVTTGGRGRDTFIFEVTGEDPTLSEDVMHDILDFVVGDRIRVLDYEIDREAKRLEKDLFKSIYQDDDDDEWLRSDLPIMVRHERTDGVDQTIIMADVDRDNVYEITINIHGIHLPINLEPSIA